MKKKYQKPACEIYEVQAEGVIAGSTKINRDTVPTDFPGVKEVKGFFSK